jgi:hypothetical protein
VQRIDRFVDILIRDDLPSFSGHGGRSVMLRRRSIGIALLGLIAFGAAGCDGGVPASGARAITPADLLEKQRMKLVEMRSQMKSRPPAKPGARH